MKSTAVATTVHQPKALNELFGLIESIGAQSAQASSMLSVLVGGAGGDVGALIEAQMETGQPGTSPILEHVRRNAQARDAFIAECGGLLTSLEVAELAGSAADNKAQIAHRWRKEGRIFAVEHRGQTYFPALQFDPATGRPRDVVARLIKTLAPYYQGWALALWFAGAHAWLDGKRPVEMLERDPGNVLDAAKKEIRALGE
jgi:hypothetical protein